MFGFRCAGADGGCGCGQEANATLSEELTRAHGRAATLQTELDRADSEIATLKEEIRKLKLQIAEVACRSLVSHACMRHTSSLVLTPPVSPSA